MTDKVIRLFKLSFKGDSLRVGGEREGSTVYQLKYTVKGRDIPVIPNSSWKGVFKRISEGIAKAKGIGTASSHNNDDHPKEKRNNEEANKRVQSILEHVNVKSEMNKGNKIKGTQLKGIDIDDEVWTIVRSNVSADYVTREDVREIIAKAVYYYMCPVDRLYGSKLFASSISFSDSLVEGNTSFQPHVVLDRTFGAQKEKRLFEEEVVEPSNITLRVVLRPEGDVQLWRYTLRYVEKMGIAVGGSKSRGLGHLTLDVEESKVGEVDGVNVKWDGLKGFLRGK